MRQIRWISASQKISDALRAAIGRTKIFTNALQYTNIEDALFVALSELSSVRKRDGAKQVIVLLTDGEPTRPLNPINAGDEAYAGKQAIEAAAEVKAKGITLYTIGLGDDARTDFHRDGVFATGLLLCCIGERVEPYLPADSKYNLQKGPIRD